jgi:hypothetical protein
MIIKMDYYTYKSLSRKVIILEIILLKIGFCASPVIRASDFTWKNFDAADRTPRTFEHRQSRFLLDCLWFESSGIPAKLGYGVDTVC